VTTAARVRLTETVGREHAEHAISSYTMGFISKCVRVVKIFMTSDK